MLKILSVAQIRDLDAYTIEHEPVSSIDLMERAAQAFSDWYSKNYSPHKKIGIVCGTGNNGGDGLAIGRILRNKNYPVQIFTIGDISKCSPDFKANLAKIEKKQTLHIENIAVATGLVKVDIIIDAIFGSGLSRPLDGLFAEVVGYINGLRKKTVSVDIASGLFADESNGDSNMIIEPDHTVSFQIPKLSFLLPQSYINVGGWHLVDIGLSEKYIKELRTNNFLIQKSDIQPLLRKKSKYDHKGVNGKLMIVAGGYGKMGAAVLSARAALRTGVGLLTMYTPHYGYQIMQTAVPEAMTIVAEENHNMSTTVPINSFTAIGIGPGLGTDSKMAKNISELLRASHHPLVIDADALNIIAEHRKLMEVVPEGSILTPHPKEFERLVGAWKNDWDRLDKQRKFSERFKIIVVLKGAHTSISDPQGRVYFNNTGNPGMATGGSGDVLLGIISSLLAQEYSPINSALIGVYIHGLAGDFASKEIGEYSLIASDIIQNLSKAMLSLTNKA